MTHWKRFIGAPPLSPELIRLLPDRAQGAYQSAVTESHHDKLTRWLCYQLAAALYEKHRYKIELAETSVKLFNLEEERLALEKESKGVK